MKKILLSFLFLFSLSFIYAQSGEDLIRCYSVEHEYLRSQTIVGYPDAQSFEEWLAPKVKAYKELPASEKNILTIPCVVHVLHNGEAEGTAPHISAEQAISQINVLNEDFSRTNPDANLTRAEFLPVAADVEIRFVMAQTSPDGLLTDGVNKVNIGQDGATRDDLENTIKPNTIWDPTQYLNMWCVKFAAPDDNLLGYAQFPEASGLAGMPSGAQSENTDGIVIRFNSFGTINHPNGANFLLDAPYDLGRTGTHEVGHWVGLRHTWGDVIGCSMGAPTPGCSCTQDDFCDDVPNSDQANYGCATTKTSACDATTTTDQIENYMDYTNDACMNMFTFDQKARVQAVMANSPRRMELPNSPAALPPGNYVQFDNIMSSEIENSSCDFRDVTVGVKITNAPSGNVTANVTASGSAEAGLRKDYELLTNTLTFTPSELRQNAVVRIYEDDVAESDEDIILTIASVSGANGEAGFTNQTHTLILQDDDDIPTEKGRMPGTEIFAEDFEIGSTTRDQWTQLNQYGSAEWNIGSSVTGLTTQSAYIGTNGVYTYAPYNTETRARFDSPIIDATNTFNLSVTFDYICQGEQDTSSDYDFGSLFYTTDGVEWLPFGPVLVNQATATTITVDLPDAASNQANLRIGFQWFNDALLGMELPFTFDNVSVTGSSKAPAPVAVTAGRTQDVYFGPNAVVNIFGENDEVIAVMEELSGFDYGCTTVEVSTEGTSAMNVGSDTEEVKKIGSKTWNVTPTTNHTDGQYRITYYITAAEMNGWTGTDRQESDLILIKTDGAAANAANIDAFEPGAAMSVTAYDGADFAASATFSTGFSGFAFADSDAFAALPLEWMAFNAEMKNGRTHLTWTTANERNTDAFIIERSADGRTFEKTAGMAAAGNSEAEIDYAVTDDNPLAGVNYYRIMQTDLDGSFSYSRVVSVNNEASDLIADLFPNPTTDILNIQTTGENIGTLRILNTLGQTVRTVQIGSSQISLGDLPAGVYFLEARAGNVRDVKRFVVR